MKSIRLSTVFATLVLLLSARAQAQHLWWNGEGQKNATCVYGEITVLVTYPSIYYCGINWHPGEPAGGYCGIQDNSLTRRSTIFSIWDTSPVLHPQATEADPQTKVRRFGGEGEGGHTDMDLDWKPGETFRFFVQKQPGLQAGTTDARYYIFDRATSKWRHLATINCPNGDKPGSVGTIGGGMNSFLENYAGKDRDVARIALYRLWLGPTVHEMKCLTRAHGDGTWGEMDNDYFLATGSSDKLTAAFADLAARYGRPVPGAKGTTLPPIADRPVPQDVIDAMEHPPVAPKVN